jgi:uridine kinase
VCNRSHFLTWRRALNNVRFSEASIQTPAGHRYDGLKAKGQVSAVVVLRGGSALETAMGRIIPDCRTGRILIQSNLRTGEPELHFLKLPEHIDQHESVMLLDAQMSSGGSALMAVQVLLDHGVAQDKIVLATYSAGRLGLHRLSKVFPDLTVVLCDILDDSEERWVEKRYFRC